MFKKNKKTKYQIIKKKETIFSLYFGWRLRVILEKTTAKLRGPFQSHKQYVVATIALILIISGALITKNYKTSKAATYTYTQTNWDGGATANTHNHTNEQASPGTWNEYESADANLNFGTSGEVSIGSEIQTLEHTTTTDFSNGTSTGMLTTGDELSLDLP